MTEKTQLAPIELETSDSSEGSRELQDAVSSLLSAFDLRGGALDEALQDLEVPYGDAVYSELFRAFCHLRLESAEAKRLWMEVLVHRGMMQDRLRGPLDLRVAMLSYLVEVQHKLEDPKIIERSELERTQESAYTDHLTGLRNYRFFAEQLNHEVLRSDQYNEPVSLLMLDLDHFKMFNDRNGHEAGNEVLRRVGDIIRATLRNVDVGARYGGEEFAVILPSTPKRGAHAAAERLRTAIKASDFPFGEHQPLGRVTASVGVATYPAEGRNAAEFIGRCDKALYAAKAEGRDRVGLLGGMRSYPRVEVEIYGHRHTTGGDSPFTTTELGTGGMVLRTNTPLELGALIETEISLPGQTPNLAITARVLRVNPGRDDSFDVAVHFVDMSQGDRRRLSSFVRDASAS